jgi:hypothetical protein
MTLLIIGFSIADFLLPTILVFAFRWDDVHDVDTLCVTSRQFQRDEMARNAVPVSTKFPVTRQSEPLENSLHNPLTIYNSPHLGPL